MILSAIKSKTLKHSLESVKMTTSTTMRRSKTTTKRWIKVLQLSMQMTITLKDRSLRWIKKKTLWNSWSNRSNSWETFRQPSKLTSKDKIRVVVANGKMTLQTRPNLNLETTTTLERRWASWWELLKKKRVTTCMVLRKKRYGSSRRPF